MHTHYHTHPQFSIDLLPTLVLKSLRPLCPPFRRSHSQSGITSHRVPVVFLQAYMSQPSRTRLASEEFMLGAQSITRAVRRLQAWTDSQSEMGSASSSARTPERDPTKGGASSHQGAPSSSTQKSQASAAAALDSRAGEEARGQLEHDRCGRGLRAWTRRARDIARATRERDPGKLELQVACHLLCRV